MTHLFDLWTRKRQTKTTKINYIQIHHFRHANVTFDDFDFFYHFFRRRRCQLMLKQNYYSRSHRGYVD